MIPTFVALCSFSVMGQEKPDITLKPALLVIDVQNACLPHMTAEGQDTVLQNVNKLIALFRKYDRPVIRVYHTDPQMGPQPGTEPFEYPKSVEVRDGDPMIIKNYASSFKKTDLEKILRENDSNTVFLCGLSATGCVIATHYGARERDFISIMMKGALLSPNASYTSAVEGFCPSMSLQEAEEALKSRSL
jgi:nicotinamidase-related amidase